ncbi:unnamed protein product [Lactuca virosa]|uniref:Uncharacterized protein n=1 Tax=Lactuca virosa TaxID=75947 RepID=A0AAU9LUB9_9ASTR|nr:unnamed protein product [Lactuca virosa]
MLLIPTFLLFLCTSTSTVISTSKIILRINFPELLQSFHQPWSSINENHHAFEEHPTKVEAPYMTWGHKMFECHDADCCTSCKNKHGINKWISTMRSIKTQGLYLEFVWMKKNMD